MTDSADPVGAPDERPSFAAAMTELTTLVDDLESDALDVDDLSARVERAAELVQWCRDRIDAARFSVEEVLVRMDNDNDNDADPG